MPPKRRVEAAEDKKEVPPAEKTKKEKIKETVNHSEEVAHILEDYRQGLFELLQIIAVKFDKMTDGLAETIIRDSLNEFDDRIRERKTSKQVIESLGSTDNMSSVNEENTNCITRPRCNWWGCGISTVRRDSRGTDGRDGRGR